MFLGTYTHRLDDKGRLTLPAKFREALAGGVMVAKGQDHSLAVYPREVFAERVGRAAKAARTSEAGRAYLRNLAAGAEEQFPDGQGRVNLSADHRRYAGLSKDCVVTGVYEYLEIWSAPAWQAYVEVNEQGFSEATEQSVGID